MISRRSFIGALAALPVVGKLFANEPAAVENMLTGTTVGGVIDLGQPPARLITLYCSGGAASSGPSVRYFLSSGGEWEEVKQMTVTSS